MQLRMIYLIHFFILINIISFDSVSFSQNIEQADQLGEEFQREAPWAKRMPQDSGYYGFQQPKDYLSAPESQVSPKESDYPIMQYPLCYDANRGRYTYCYPNDNYSFRLRYRSPKARFMFDYEKNCLPENNGIPGRCYRY